MGRKNVTWSRRNRLFFAAPAFLLLTSLSIEPGRSQAPPDVAETTLENSQPADRPGRHRREQNRPVKMGTSGGTIEDVDGFPPIACCGGTLGALLKKEDRYFVLSNNHIIARLNEAEAGEGVVQPGQLDSDCLAPEENIVANLTGFKRLRINGTNRVDAAIAETTPDLVDEDGAIIGIGVPGNDVVKPRVGAETVKSGRTTGVTRGQVSATNVSGNVEFPLSCAVDAENVEIFFTGAFTVVSTEGTTFSGGGDSGSVIYEDVDECPRAMGLLFAGSDVVTAGNPMKRVMRAVRKMKPRGPAELVGCDPIAVASAGGYLERADPVERFAARVQSRIERSILGLPSVVAIGLGRAASDPDEVVFRIFVENAPAALDPAIPSSIEGIPVEVTVSGKLRALHCPSEELPRPARGGLATALVR